MKLATEAGWTKSSRCSNHLACVYIQALDGVVGLRDENHATPPLLFPSRQFAAFLAAVKADEFDPAIVC